MFELYRAHACALRRACISTNDSRRRVRRKGHRFFRAPRIRDRAPYYNTSTSKKGHFTFVPENRTGIAERPIDDSPSIKKKLPRSEERTARVCVFFLTTQWRGESRWIRHTHSSVIVLDCQNKRRLTPNLQFSSSPLANNSKGNTIVGTVRTMRSVRLFVRAGAA